MSIVNCSNGHHFDDVKFNKCPICGESINYVDKMKKFVFSTDNANVDGDALTERYVDSDSNENDLTISIDMKNSKNSLTTGWLVCVRGECLGKSYPIFTGRNFIGRDVSSDIVIADKSVSKSKHCSIVFDDKNLKFFVLHGTNIVTVNNALIEENVKLKENDIITIGKSDFVFIPYCKKGRTWNV